MKTKKVDVEILLEALAANATIHGTKGDLLGIYIGSVEIIAYEVEDGYETDLYPAVQLPTGEIVCVDKNYNAFTLRKNSAIIRWGYYPDNFPNNWKTKRSCPEEFKFFEYKEYETSRVGITIIDDDELPF